MRVLNDVRLKGRGRRSELSVISREAIIKGLKKGRTLIIDRKDAPELQDLLELEREGLVKGELVQFNDQSSGIRWRWVL